MILGSRRSTSRTSPRSRFPTMRRGPRLGGSGRLAGESVFGIRTWGGVVAMVAMVIVTRQLVANGHFARSRKQLVKLTSFGRSGLAGNGSSVPCFSRFSSKEGAPGANLFSQWEELWLAAATTEAQMSAFRGEPAGRRLPLFTVKRPRDRPEGGKRFQANLFATYGGVPPMPDMPSFARETWGHAPENRCAPRSRSCLGVVGVACGATHTSSMARSATSPPAAADGVAW